MATTIKTKNSIVTTVEPVALEQGELAVNIADKKLWVGDDTTAPVLIGDIDGVTDIAHGGTNGTQTPTSGGVAYGNGTRYNFTSAGIAGQFLVSAGSGAPSWTSSGVDGFSTCAVYDASGTFTVPSSGKFKVTIVNGGNGALNSSSYATNGGNGGSTTIKYINGATPGASVTVTVGAGGASNGGSGGSSSISSVGTVVSSVTVGGGYGTRIYAVYFPGGSGSNYLVDYCIGGTGGGSLLAVTGGLGGIWNTNADPKDGANATVATNGYGAGGGGVGGNQYGTLSTGGTGSQGVVIFEY